MAETFADKVVDLADVVGVKVADLEASQAALVNAATVAETAYLDALDRLKSVWEAEIGKLTYTQSALVDQLASSVEPPAAGLEPAQQIELTAPPRLEAFGVDRETGKWTDGWEHVVQSIQDILTTRILTRVFRREYGSDVPRLIDMPTSDRVVLAVQVAAATALKRWEPRFELLRLNIEDADAQGRLTLLVRGIYYPKWGVRDGVFWIDRTVTTEKTGFSVWK